LNPDSLLSSRLTGYLLGFETLIIPILDGQK